MPLKRFATKARAFVPEAGLTIATHYARSARDVIESGLDSHVLGLEGCATWLWSQSGNWANRLVSTTGSIGRRGRPHTEQQ